MSTLSIRFLLLDRKTNRSAITAISARTPPTVPPAIAPTLVLLDEAKTESVGLEEGDTSDTVLVDTGESEVVGGCMEDGEEEDNDIDGEGEVMPDVACGAKAPANDIGVLLNLELICHTCLEEKAKSRT